MGSHGWAGPDFFVFGSSPRTIEKNSDFSGTFRLHNKKTAALMIRRA